MATASTTGIQTNTASQQAVKDQMAANSLAWHGASAAEQSRLEQANRDLATQLGGNVAYNDSTGTWSGSATNPNNVASARDVVTNTATQADIVAQMNANSQQWHRVDPSQRGALEQANRELAAQLGGNVAYNDTTGTWSGTADVSPTGRAVANSAGTLNTYGVKPITPALRGLSLGDTYGLTYDYNTILDKLNNATTASYGVKEQEAKQIENQYYNKMVDTQSSALDTLRKSQAAAVATGASRGMAAANELSAILGLQQTMAPEATTLAQNRDNISTQKQAAMEKNASSALDASNAVKQAIAGIDGTLYGYDTQQNIGILDYLAALAGSATNAYASDNTLAGVKYNADQNTESSRITAAANEAVAKINAATQAARATAYTPSSSGSSSNSGSSSSGSSSSGASSETPTETNSGETYKVPNSTDYMKQQSDGTYLYYTTNEQGKEVPTRLTAAQATIVKGEETLDALKPGYATDQVGRFVEGGVVTNDSVLYVGEIPWTWDSEAKIWRNGEYSATTKILKSQLEAIEAQKAAAAEEDRKNNIPAPNDIPWYMQTPTMG